MNTMPRPIHRYRLLLPIGLFVLLLSGCGKGDESAPETASQTKDTPALQPAEKTMRPQWITQQSTWPDTIRWTVDSTWEVSRDDLLLRIRPDVSQDISGMRFQNERPLICELVTTMSPVPEWKDARGFVVDSVRLRDPVGHTPIRSLHMISFQRGYEKGTVRTQFLANQGDAFRQSPNLKENQRLDMTVYMTWDKRHLIAEMPPVTLVFVRNPEEGVKHREPEPAYPPPPTPRGGP